MGMGNEIRIAHCSLDWFGLVSTTGYDPRTLLEVCGDAQLGLVKYTNLNPISVRSLRLTAYPHHTAQSVISSQNPGIMLNIPCGKGCFKSVTLYSDTSCAGGEKLRFIHSQLLCLPGATIHLGGWKLL